MCTVHLMSMYIATNRNECSPLYMISFLIKGYACPSCTACIYYPVIVCPSVLFQTLPPRYAYGARYVLCPDQFLI